MTTVLSGLVKFGQPDSSNGQTVDGLSPERAPPWRVANNCAARQTPSAGLRSAGVFAIAPRQRGCISGCIPRIEAVVIIVSPDD